MPTYGHFIPYGHFPIQYILYGHFIPYGYFPLWTLFHMEEHSVEEVLERPTGYPKVGGSNHGSGDFSLQPQRNPYLS